MRERGLRQRGAVQIALRPEFSGGRQLVVVVPARPPPLATIIDHMLISRKSTI